VWEWSIATGAFGQEGNDGADAKASITLALSIAEDDAPAPDAAVRANPLGTKKGYDPYDSGKLWQAPAPPRKKDLSPLERVAEAKEASGRQQGRRVRRV